MASGPSNDPSRRSKQRQIICCPWREEGGGERERSCKLELLDVIQRDGILSTMYSCRDTDTNKKYLLKRVYLHRLKEKDVEYRLREVPIWTGLRHRYILTCFTGWQSGAELWLLSEAAGETLERVVREKGLPPPQPLFEHWLYQLASALEYLHEFQDKPILHRNLKPSNIVVVPHYVLKLTDFGFSKELQDREAMTTSRVGTAAVMSPEMVNNQRYSTKTDMWGLGITAVFIATQQDAISAGTFDTLFRKTRQGQVRGIGGRYSPGIENLVHSLLQVDPRHRPSASEFITHLRLCSKRCATPATAHSYPARQMVPQVRHNSSDAPSVSRPGSGLRSGSRSEDARRRQDHVAHRVQSEEDTERSASSEDVASGDVGRSPGVDSLSLSLLYVVIGKKDRPPRAGSAGQGRDPSRRSLGDSETAKRRQTLPIAETAEQTATSDAQVVPRRGGSESEEGISDDRTARAPGKKTPASSPPHGEGGMHASAERSAPRANSYCGRNEAKSGRRRSEGSKHTDPERNASSTNSCGERLPVPSQRRDKRNEDSIEGSKPTSRKNNVPADDKSFSAATDDHSDRPTRYVRERSPEDVHLDEQEDVFSQDDEFQSTDTLTSDTMTLDTMTSDTLTSNPQLINTFPGAFNVAALSRSADRCLSLHHRPRHVPPVEKSDGSERPPSRHRSECDTSRDAGGGGMRNGGEDATGLTHTSVLFDAPVDSWPENMRQYWILANDLVKRLGADTFFTALKIASLFSEGEVRQWLQERGVDSAGQCMDSLRRLIELDAQLDDDTVRTFNLTLMGTSTRHDGESPA